MPAPEQLKIHRVIKVYPGDIAPGVNSVSIWTEEHATSGDVIEAVLDKLDIPASPDRFDLIEVYDNDGEFVSFPELRGRARTIMEFESPAKVQIEWNMKENDTSFGEYRFYLRQKSNNLVGEKMPDVRVTWLNGLHVDNESSTTIEPNDWNFEPSHREPDEIDDLVDLPVLNEPILLENIQKRFFQRRIYTYVGGILLAVNPFKYFPIYNPKYVLAYQHRRLMELPPHIFAIADVGYHRMLKDKRDQCIVISGESGSGKTENTKLILHHLTALSHKTQATVLERTILAAGPVLEAFGNAKTHHNNNSSRFGKFTQIDYRADGVVCGAILKKYLLEKSRIVRLAENERNYHVFYYLLVGATQAERKRLHLMKAEDYFYLNQSNCYSIEAVEEDYEFFRLQQAMRNIGFTGEVQQRIFSVLSAVLHIGNVKFKKKESHEDSVDVEENGVVDIISKLLEVDKVTLIESFTRRKTVTRGEQFIRRYKRAEAYATRDSMAKALYGSLFDWIVLQINHTLKTRHKGKTDVKAYSIGVLDIFGFEDFEINSFEQLCINYANENLQFYLNQHIFKIRQDEYIREKLNWRVVAYEDNQSCLDLMVGKLGLFSLLDEECSLTVGTHESLLAKLNKHHGSNRAYEKPPTKESAFSIIHYAGPVKYQVKDFKAKNQDLMRHDVVTSLRNSKMLFVRELMGSDPMAVFYWSIIRHTIKAITLFKKAGQAHRDGEVFLENCPKVTWATKTSSPEKLKLMIEVARYGPRGKKVISKRPTDNRRNSVKEKHSTIRKRNQARRYMASGISEQMSSGTSRKVSTLNRPRTVVAQFQSSLTELLETLNESHPFFVRCIRSNTEKAPLKFDADVVLRQLRYTGMLSCVEIRQAGYPCRISIQDFIKEYKLILPKKDATKSKEIPNCLVALGLDSNHYQVGKTKIFMRESQYKLLRDKLQNTFDCNAQLIQRWFRREFRRRELRTMGAAAITIQSHWRRYLAEMKYRSLLLKRREEKIAQRQMQIRAEKAVATLTIQRNWRRYIAQKRVKLLKIQQNQLILMAKEEEEEHMDLDVKSKAEAIVNDVLSTTFFKQELPATDVLSTTFFKKELPATDVLPTTFFYQELPATDVLPTTFSKQGIPITDEASVTDAGTVDTQGEWIHEKDYTRHIYEKVNYEHLPFQKDHRSASAGTLDYPKVASVDSGLSTKAESAGSISRLDYSNQNIYEKITNQKTDRSSSGSSSGRRTPYEDVISDGEVTNEHKKNNKRISRRKSFRERVSHQFTSSKPQPPSRRSMSDIEAFVHIPLPDATLNISDKPELIDRKELEIPLVAGTNQSLIRNFLVKMKVTKKNSDTTPRKQPAIPTRSTDPMSPMSSGGKEWKPTETFIIYGDAELEAINDFFAKKLVSMNKSEKSKHDTKVDFVFKKALNQYHANLLTTYASVRQRNEVIRLKFDEMSSTFVGILNQIIATDKIEMDLANMGVNVFGGIIDEFLKIKSQGIKKKPHHRQPKKRKRALEYTEHFGHRYLLKSFSIYTFCEYCNSFIWDRGCICQGCSFTCHKKCSTKYKKACRGRKPSVGALQSLFGTNLVEITTNETPIPPVINRLMQELENRGLFSEGIYRKPGLQAAVNSLKNTLMTKPVDELDLAEYRVYVIASVLKLFFRQLPVPLIPDEFYNDFIRSVELQNENEIHSTLYQLIEKRFPKPNRELLERLIFHLARVAREQNSNLMSPTGLSIVWAPCLMRAPKDVDPMEVLHQLGPQSVCVEILINYQVKKIQQNISDIGLLQTAAYSAEDKLNDLRQRLDNNGDGSNDEVRTLQEQISTFDEERNRLTENLATLGPRSLSGQPTDSDDGLMSDDGLTDTDELNCRNEEYPSSFDHPAFPTESKGLTKGRSYPVKRRKPSGETLLRRNSDSAFGSLGDTSMDTSSEFSLYNE